jgi:hypothetical protein
VFNICAKGQRVVRVENKKKRLKSLKQDHLCQIICAKGPRVVRVENKKTKKD